ncbi:hypothetical protein OSJ77_18165 [Phyllobacterium sp. 0TCS1.6C]|jgi:hypothetical protein|uniref:hypothetical protein n=1 Tax=unclassified Phyllobacterium TaxID=2638441 RepID=UPI002265355D|nr:MULTISPECIES: hypothetical protein [unclassified Phyllobacterium]MCX8282117.1 hypothetical protein [Phyllobacterium sp. 0TCS1.6C]MCX8296325.1 hypothetical protein [Phyllobacterium sp. 0TCS1.6A]
MANLDPTLDELLDDPIIRLVMQSDGVAREDVRLAMNAAKIRSAIADAGISDAALRYSNSAIASACCSFR